MREVETVPEAPAANPEDHEDTEQVPDETRSDCADPITKDQTPEQGATEHPRGGVKGGPLEAAP